MLDKDFFSGGLMPIDRTSRIESFHVGDGLSSSAAATFSFFPANLALWLL